MHDEFSNISITLEAVNCTYKTLMRCWPTAVDKIDIYKAVAKAYNCASAETFIFAYNKMHLKSNAEHHSAWEEIVDLLIPVIDREMKDEKIEIKDGKIKFLPTDEE